MRESERVSVCEREREREKQKERERVRVREERKRERPFHLRGGWVPSMIMMATAAVGFFFCEGGSTGVLCLGLSMRLMAVVHLLLLLFYSVILSLIL